MIANLDFRIFSHKVSKYLTYVKIIFFLKNNFSLLSPAPSQTSNIFASLFLFLRRLGGSVHVLPRVSLGPFDVDLVWYSRWTLCLFYYRKTQFSSKVSKHVWALQSLPYTEYKSLDCLIHWHAILHKFAQKNCYYTPGEVLCKHCGSRKAIKLFIDEKYRASEYD